MQGWRYKLWRATHETVDNMIDAIPHVASLIGLVTVSGAALGAMASSLIFVLWLTGALKVLGIE